MKKHLALLLALTMTVGAALTGCGGSASSSAAASSEAGSSKASSAAAPASAETLVLGTGGTTGTYYAVGGVMQSVLNPKLTLSQLNVTSTGASKANILDVDDGVSQLATVQNDVMYYAANGTDLFESDGKFDTFSTVACLYAETCQIIASADSGIQTVADLKGKTVVVSGAGNVATYAIEKAWQLGAKPVTCSDSTGWIYDPDGIDVATLIDVKQVKRARLTEYAKARPKSVYHEGKGVWTTKCDVALPCATQNELLLDDAKALVANGCFAVVEGANMPTSLDATKYLQEQGILFCPGKAANAGGVATSALEMTQNSQRLSWTFEEVDAKLKDIMVNIFHNLDAAAKEYGMEGNYVAGANIAGFLKVADAMNAQGIV